MFVLTKIVDFLYDCIDDIMNNKYIFMTIVPSAYYIGKKYI